jgi:Mce-associated membrane protein
VRGIRVVSTRVLLVTAAVTCLGAMLCGGLAWEKLHREADGRAAVSAAESAVPTLLSYNVARLDEDLAAGAALTTGPFAREYVSLVDSVLRPAGATKQVVTSASVSGAAVVSNDGDGVVVLIFIDRQSTSVSHPVPQIDAAALRVTMQRVDGRWLIAGLVPA